MTGRTPLREALRRSLAAAVWLSWLTLPAAAGGLQEHVIDVGGIERRYLEYRPERLGRTSRPPLVLDLHASGIGPEYGLAITGMVAAADRYGFVVVAPAASLPWPRGGATWNVPPSPGGPDDVAFIETLIERLTADGRIDGRRVFAAGYSGGARFASFLACTRPELVTAIAAVGGLRYGDTADGECAASAMSVIAIHSEDDPVNPFTANEGAAPAYWRYGVLAAVEGWVRHNGCGAARQIRLDKGLNGTAYGYDCVGHADVVFYRLRGSGHVWPGSVAAFPAFVGKPEPAVPATDIIVRFFLEHGASSADSAAGMRPRIDAD